MQRSSNNSADYWKEDSCEGKKKSSYKDDDWTEEFMWFAESHTIVCLFL